MVSREEAEERRGRVTKTSNVMEDKGIEKKKK
jgi:hypothetical protein